MDGQTHTGAGTAVGGQAGQHEMAAMDIKKELSTLTDADREQVAARTKQINLSDTQQIVQYGAASQKNIADFSESALARVRTKDIGEVGDVLTSMAIELKGFTANPEPKKGLFGILKRGADQLEIMKTKYSTVEANVNKIVNVLEGHKIQLLKDIAMLDQMYAKNLDYYKELTLDILAGREKLGEALKAELPALRLRAEQSGQPQDAQAARDYEDMCMRFEKKLHDLDLTRTISMQMGPQIRLVQNNDSTMVEKIQSSIVNTIPLWKNQMTIALGLANSRKALNAQKAVSDMTNELLKKNADMLKASTIETAKEAERGIVDIETIQYTNQQLISTIEEVLQIQEDGRQRRRSAEAELTQIENDLKKTLLSTRNR